MPAKMKNRSVSLTSAILSYPKSDIDPDINILVIRATAFRRLWYKSPQHKEKTQENLQLYTQLEWKGTQHNDINEHIPAPPSGHPRGAGAATTRAPGPIGLFLQSLHYCATAIDLETLTIVSKYHLPIHLFDSPYQFYIQAIESIGTQARFEASINTRKELAAATPVDIHTTTKLFRAIKGPTRPILLAFHTGALWFGHKLSKFSPTNTGCCPFCGHPAQDIEHVIYYCPHFKGTREQCDIMANLDPQDLLVCLRLLGLAPHLGANLTQTFWPPLVTRLGSTHNALLGANKNKHFIKLIDVPDKADVTAIRTLIKKRGTSHGEYPPPPARCDETPPVRPNAYNDGGVKFTTTLYLTLSAAASHQPFRTAPQTIQEAHFFKTRTEHDGVANWIAVPQPLGASGRTEILGGLMSLHMPGPAHIVADSSYYLEMALRLLPPSTTPDLQRKPWGLRTDGDLWTVYHEATLAKSTTAIRYTKVKSEHTEPDDQRHLHNEEHLQGNKKADALVQQAFLQHDAVYRHYTYAVEARLRTYQKIITALQTTQLAILVEATKEFTSLTKRNKLMQGPMPKDQAVRILSTTTIRSSPDIPKKLPKHDHRNYYNIHHYLRQTHGTVTKPGKGITWLELLVRYELATGRPIVMPQPPNTSKQLQIRPNIATLLRKFKMLVRAMAKHAFQPRQCTAFTTKATSSYRLRSIGYLHSTPALAWLPTSTTDMDISTKAALLAIKKGRTPSHASIAEGIARTTIGKLQNAAQPGWRALLPTAPHANQDQPRQPPTADRIAPVDAALPTAQRPSDLLHGSSTPEAKRQCTATHPSPPDQSRPANTAATPHHRKRKRAADPCGTPLARPQSQRPTTTHAPHPTDHLPMTYTTICNIPQCHQQHIHTRLPRQDFFSTGWVQVYCVTTRHSSWIGDHSCQSCLQQGPQCKCIAAIPQPRAVNDTPTPQPTESPVAPPVQPNHLTRGAKRPHVEEPQDKARGARKPHPKLRHDTATHDRPYTTLCATLNPQQEPCQQTHAHFDKLNVKNNSAALKDFYRWKCKTQKSLTTHSCAHCTRRIVGCTCTIKTDATTQQRSCVTSKDLPQQPPHQQHEIASGSTSAPQYATLASSGTQQSQEMREGVHSQSSTAMAPKQTKRKATEVSQTALADTDANITTPELDTATTDPAPSPRIKRARSTEITTSHPYGTLCGTRTCRQTHSHTSKPDREPLSIRWLNFYCFQCQVSARMGNHICRHCHTILASCNCKVAPINGGATKRVIRSTQLLPWATHVEPPAHQEPHAVPDITVVIPAKATAQTPKAKPRAVAQPQRNNLRSWLSLNAAPPAQRIFANRTRSRRPATSRPLTLGTDCSGMDAVAHAIKSFGIPLTHVFASDPEHVAQEPMRANHTIQHLYQFLQDRPMTHTDLDVYAAGPPCQPFSGIGLQQGLSDPRAALYQQRVEYILQARPKIFIIENMPGFKTFDKGVHLAHLIALLCAPPHEAPNSFYHVTHHTTSTHLHGIPHNRRRLYVIGIRADVQQQPFVMPESHATHHHSTFRPAKSSRQHQQQTASPHRHGRSQPARRSRTATQRRRAPHRLHR